MEKMDNKHKQMNTAAERWKPQQKCWRKNKNTVREIQNAFSGLLSVPDTVGGSVNLKIDQQKLPKLRHKEKNRVKKQNVPEL